MPLTDARSVRAEYKRYTSSATMRDLALAAHGADYCGQTSSATFVEIADILRGIDLPSRSVLLDAGCGNGCFDVRVASEFGFTVHGIDLAPELIDLARAEAQANGLDARCHFHTGDFNDITALGIRVDVVMAVGSLYWTPQLSETLAAWSASLGATGTIVIFANVTARPLDRSESAGTGETIFPSEPELMGVFGTSDSP